MNRKLKVAVAGLGRIGWGFHFHRLSTLSDRFRLVAAVDPLPERRAEMTAAAGCPAYADFDDLWRGEKPDLVVVATPTLLHETMTCRALAEGCHVVLEKPMAVSLASADRMIARAADARRRIFVYQTHRLTPETQTARLVIESGLLGEIYALRRAVYRYVRRNDWQSLRRNGGGMLNNYGAHYLDQLLYLSDASPVADVRCRLWAVATRGDAEDVVRTWVTKSSGQLLDVEINQASACVLPGWHICGRYGTAVCGEGGFEARFYDPAAAPALEVIDGAAPGRSYGNQDCLPWQERAFPIEPGRQLDFYANIYDALVNGAEPYIPLEQSRELMRVLDLCRADAGIPAAA